MSKKKDVLGWNFNGITFRISFPILNVEKLRKVIRETLYINTPSLKKFQKLVGRLQNSAIGIPSSKGIFQLLNTAIKKTQKHQH